MRFLQQAMQQQRRKLLIANWLLLALRCLFLILLGLALAQPVLASLFLQPGRHVHLFIDNGITTTARVDGTITRFDGLRDEALTIADALNGSDRLTIWPLVPDAEPLTFDLGAQRDQALEALAELRPTHTGTIPIQRFDQLQQSAVDPTQPAVAILLSDLASSDQRWNTTSPTESQQVGRWLIRTPEPEQRHHQIRRLTTPRSAVVPDRLGSLLVLPVHAELVRLQSNPPELSATLTLTVLSETGETLHTHTAQTLFGAGEQQKTLRELVTLPTGTLLPDSLDATRLILQLVWDSENDPLPVDNTAQTSIEIRRQARILIQHSGQPGLSSARWLALAMNPTQDDQPDLNVALTRQIGPSVLNDTDVLMLTQPQDLTTPQINIVRDWVSSGQTAVVLPPSVNLPAMTDSNPIAAAFAQPVEFPADAPAGFSPALASAGPLSALTAEWPTLARSIRIMRLQPLIGSDANTLIGLRQEGARQPWLAARSEGTGQWLYLTTRVEPEWTNLSIKPLFVPLIQTLVRDFLPARMPTTTRSAGTLTTDTTAWVNTTDPTLDPLSYAGRYTDPNNPDRWLFVRPDADAADLTATRRDRIESLIGPQAEKVWVNPSGWREALTDTRPKSAAGTPVLWLALVLLLSELVIARWASTGEHRWW